MPQSDGNATPFTQSQVLISLHKWNINLVHNVGATQTLNWVHSNFQPWTISIMLRPWDYYDESRLQRAVSQGKAAHQVCCTCVLALIILSITKLAPPLLAAGHSSDGGKDSGDHPQQLSRDRPPFGRWRARLCPPPDNWTGPWLSGEESAWTHHLQLLLRTHWQAGEARSGGEHKWRNQRFLEGRGMSHLWKQA